MKKSNAMRIRLIVMLLTLCTLLACMAGTAMAADHTHTFESGNGKCDACGEPMAKASVTTGGVTTYYAKLDEALAKASVTTGGVTTYYATLDEALTAAQGKTATVELLKDAQITVGRTITSGVTFDGGEYVIAAATSDVWLNNKGTIAGGTFTGTVVNHRGSVTGGSFNVLKCDRNSSVSGKISFRTLVNLTNSTDYDLSQAVDIEGATVQNSVGELPASKLKLPDGYALAVGRKIVSVLSGGVSSTIVAHPEHIYVDGVCACGLAATYTLALEEDVAGVEIESVSIDGEELILGGEIRVQHGKDLTVKLKNTLSETETDVFAAACTSAGNTIEHTFDGADTLTIPGGSVNQNIYISAVPYVRVQFNLNGGMVTDAGKAKFSSLGCTWDEENDALKALYDTGISDLSDVFGFSGHTFIGVKADGSDDVVSALGVRGDTTVDILWNCDGSTLTHVPAKDATCKEAGNIAHYVCTCSKLYAEDKTTELTAEQIRTPVDPDAHSINAQTGSCVYCGEPMAAASVTIGGVTTYYAKLDEALNAPNGMTATVKLLKDAEITEDHTIPMGVTFDGGKFTVSGEDLVNLGGTIAGGTFKAEVINMGGSIAGGVFDRISYCEGSVYGPISFKHLDNVGYSPSINLSQAVSIEGANISTITSALSVSDLKLPDGYALEVNGQIVSTLQSAQGGTIVAHLEHNYVDGVCGCGEVCDHVIDNDGECACGKVVAAASVTTDGVTTYYATLKEALSAAQGKTAKVDLLKDAEIIGNDSIDLGVTFDGGEFTVSGGHLANGGTIVGGTFTVTIMNFGGSVTGGSFATLYCYNGSVSGEISFETLSNDGDDMDYDLSQAVDIEGATVRNSAAELPASKLKLPDGYALAVGGQIVSVLEQGQNGTIVAHLEHNYVDGVCGCGAECDHAAIDNDGKCTECGLQYAASVTIGDVTTYYTELDDALDDAANETATVRLLADGEMTENVNYDSPSNITLDMNGKTITAKATLSVADEAPLTITGSGIINAAGATPIMITDGVVTVAGDLTFNGAEPGFAFEYPGTLDLSGVNGSIDGWRVMNICTDDEIAVGDNITLPDGYALKVGDNFAAGLNGNETGTIVAHTHEYGTVEYNSLSHWKQCVCGAIDESSKTKHTIAGQINPDGETHRMGCTGCDFVDLGAGSLGHNWNGSGKCEQCPSEAVAKVDDAYFAVFANAVEAWKAESAQAMTLLADVTYGDVIRLQSGGARTLDLNGHTLTNTVMSDYALRHFVPLTVNDSSTNRTGKFIADSVRVSVIYSDSTTLTVNGGTFTTSNRPYALNLNYANAEVNSDNVKLEAVAPINVSGASDSNSLTITGSGCDGWKICNNCWNAVPISIPYGFHLEDEEGKQLAANNSLPAGAYTFIKADHVHAWSYAADDDADVITAVCANADGHCPDTQQSLTLSAADAVYSGNPVEAEVTQDGADLTYTLHYTGTDYDSPDAPVNAGDYTVTMTVGDKSIEKSFTISPKDISAVQSIHFGLSQTSFVYNGEAPVLNVTGVDSSVGSYTMQEGTDYSVGTVQVNAGSHKLTVTGMGNYTGSVELAYEINCAPIDAAVITAEAQVYTGGALEPAFTVKLDGKELKHNEDFVFAFSDNVNVGEGKIVINGIGNYEGQAEGTFAIAMADAALSVQTDKDLYTYGETVTVTASRAAKPATFARRSAIAPDQMALFLGD
ncbi:MAG: hypothetical protein IJ381_01785, partial [Clostridia bacterium]|nr:hypothetical protein [Clostridia bacterium]